MSSRLKKIFAIHLTDYVYDLAQNVRKKTQVQNSKENYRQNPQKKTWSNEREKMTKEIAMYMYHQRKIKSIRSTNHLHTPKYLVETKNIIGNP